MLTKALPKETSSFGAHVLNSDRRARAVNRSVPPRLNEIRAWPTQTELDVDRPVMSITPAQAVRRRMVSWKDVTVEVVQAVGSERAEYRHRGNRHLLVFFEQLSRRSGETTLDGLPSSSLRDLSRKLVFVPAGCEFNHWQEARTPGRMVMFCFGPESLLVGAGDTSAPRLFFEDSALLSTIEKLGTLIEGPDSDNYAYLEALGRVLTHELGRA